MSQERQQADTDPACVPGWRQGRLRGAASAAAESPRVLKIGGSLLSRSAWPRHVSALVAAGPPTGRTLVVGGGAVVDGLRRIDAAAPQSDELMHALAIEAMRLTARLVATALGLAVSSSPAEGAATVVLDAALWLENRPRGPELPVGWHVTSDSIAARVAVAVAGSLLLAKSTAPPRSPAGRYDLSALTAAGWVDEHFPIAADDIAVIDWAAPG
jgi:hypothetical protein